MNTTPAHLSTGNLYQVIFTFSDVDPNQLDADPDPVSREKKMENTNLKKKNIKNKMLQKKYPLLPFATTTYMFLLGMCTESCASGREKTVSSVIIDLVNKGVYNNPSSPLVCPFYTVFHEFCTLFLKVSELKNVKIMNFLFDKNKLRGPH